MIKSVPICLITVGGCLVLGPVIYTYLVYKLGAETAAQIVTSGKFHIEFPPVLPEYYIPACLTIGILCIACGTLLGWRNRDPIPRPIEVNEPIRQAQPVE